MKNTFLLIMFFFILSSCNHKPQGPITLNQGQKWKVNPEMIEHIKASEKAFAEYVSNNQTDYTALAKTLHSNNDNLIKSCTMTGPAHDELHKWLHPHLQLVKGLEDAKSDSEANKIVQQLNNSFETLNSYFE
jgi:hypothetical protein